MQATKLWHCSCCDAEIQPGDEMQIILGDILKGGHQMKTEQMELGGTDVKRAWHKYQRELPIQQPLSDGRKS